MEYSYRRYDRSSLSFSHCCLRTSLMTATKMSSNLDSWSCSPTSYRFWYISQICSWLFNKQPQTDHSLIDSSILSFILSLIYSFVFSLIHSFIHSFILSLIHSFIHSFFRWFIHSFILSLIHSFIRSFILSLIHSFIHSFFLSLIHSFKLGNQANKKCKIMTYNEESKIQTRITEL